MKEVRYMISDAAKKISVEPHVLRYWEEELEVGIPRNEMGHRYYREEDIRMMQGVKYLKERGFQLKSIKILLPDAEKVMQLPHRRLLELRDRLELAVSREELRMQREKELQESSVEKEAQAGTDTEQRAEKPAAAWKDEAAGPEEKEGETDMAAKQNVEDTLGRTNQAAAEDNMKVKPEHESSPEAATKQTADEQKEKAAAQEIPQQKENVLGGQAARLIEIWQGGKEDSKMHKKRGARPEFNAVAQSKTLRDCAAAEEPYPHAEIRAEEGQFQNSVPEVRVSDNAVRMQQFKGIMNEIITDAMRENNQELAGSITSSVSREMEYLMRKRETMLEEHFKQLDRTLREYQLGQKQAAVARECGGRKSKFFRKNKKVRI